MRGGPALCELAFTAPFAALGGGLYGFHVAGALGLPWWLGTVGGALALVGFVAFQVALEPWVVDRLGGRDGRWGTAVAYLWDVATGTVVGLPVLAVLAPPSLPGAGAAVTAGAVYGFLMGGVVCGEGAETAVRTLLAGGGIRHRSDLSHAAVLEQRGALSEALRSYGEAVAADPTDPRPWLGIARVHERKGDVEGAARALREALTRARFTPEEEVMCLQHLVDLLADTGRRGAAAPDLARYLERSPDGRGAAWARAELAAIKDEVARALGRGGAELPADPAPTGRSDP